MKNRRQGKDYSTMTTDQVGLLSFTAGIMLCIIVTLVFNSVEPDCHIEPKEVQIP